MNKNPIVDSNVEVYISKRRCVAQGAGSEHNGATVFAIELDRFTEIENNPTTSIRTNNIHMPISVTGATSHHGSMQLFISCISRDLRANSNS